MILVKPFAVLGTEPLRAACKASPVLSLQLSSFFFILLNIFVAIFKFVAHFGNVDLDKHFFNKNVSDWAIEIIKQVGCLPGPELTWVQSPKSHMVHARSDC